MEQMLTKNAVVTHLLVVPIAFPDMLANIFEQFQYLFLRRLENYDKKSDTDLGKNAARYGRF